MKKVFAFVAVALFCTNIFAQNCKLNNPTDANGYIVLWDCANDDFAESNNFMPGQTVTLAFDVTGSVWETALQGAAPEGTTLTLAAHIWFDIVKNGQVVKSAVDRLAHTERLMQISGNIYGATINLAQELEANTAGNGATAVVSGTDLWARACFHIANFKNSDGTPGDVWGQEWHDVDYGAGVCLFATKASDGTQDPAFTGADYSPAMFINDQAGYAAPCGTTATELPTNVANKKAPKFIENGNLYFLSNGVKYNALGTAIAK